MLIFKSDGNIRSVEFKSSIYKIMIWEWPSVNISLQDINCLHYYIVNLCNCAFIEIVAKSKTRILGWNSHNFLGLAQQIRLIWKIEFDIIFGINLIIFYFVKKYPKGNITDHKSVPILAMIKKLLCCKTPSLLVQPSRSKEGFPNWHLFFQGPSIEGVIPNSTLLQDLHNEEGRLRTALHGVKLNT